MDYKPKRQPKFFIYVSLAWFIVLAVFWSAIYNRETTRRALDLQQSMETNMDKVLNLENSIKPFVSDLFIGSGKTPAQIEQETLNKIVGIYHIGPADRLMIFNGETLVYHRIGYENISAGFSPGMTITQLENQQKSNPVIQVSDFVSGFRTAGEGKIRFTLDSKRGWEYGAWLSADLPIGRWTVVYTTPEDDIIEASKSNRTIRTVIAWSLGVSVLSLLVLAILYYQFGRDRKIIKKIQQLVDEKAVELNNSEGRYRSLVENMGEGILIVDPESRQPAFANPAGLRMLKAQAVEEIGQQTLEGLMAECSKEIANLNEAEPQAASRQALIRAGTVDASLANVNITCSHISFAGKPALMFVMEDISERRRVEASLHRRASEFAALYAMSKKLTTQSDPEPILEDLLDYSMAMVSANYGELYLLNDANNMLELKLNKGGDYSPDVSVPLGVGAVGLAGSTRQPQLVEKYLTWEHRKKEFDHLKVGSLMALPMEFGGELLGVICVFETKDFSRVFTEPDARLLDMFASQAAAALHNARMLEETRDLYRKTETRLRRISTLFDINTVFNTNMDLHLTLKVMLDQVISQLNVDAADVILYNKGTRELEFAGGVRFRTTGFEQLQLDFTHDYAGRAISRANILTIPDISADKDICVRGKFMGLEGFVSYVGTPMISKGEPQGVLEIFHRTPFNLDYEGMEFIETLAGQAAMAINNATLFEGLQRSNREMAHTYDATIEGWVRTLDMRDQETEGHSQRVVNLTLKLARQAGIADERLVDVRRGALLHDIGKIGIPDSVLRKPGPLNDEEWVVMRTHPVLAYEMMSAVPFLRTSADIPYCHHEKWDGSGYPRKLAGEQIPFTARLFAVVDVWDALTSDRPYRKAWDDQKAMDYIKEQSGKHFDPYVIDLFLGLIGE